MKQIIFSIIAVIFSISLFAQQSSGKKGVLHCSQFGISRPLRDFFINEKDIVIRENEQRNDRENRAPQKFLHTAEEGLEYGNEPATIQSQMGSRFTVAMLSNWAGQNGVCPPDPTGAVGINHYVQAVNATPFKIFNKSSGTQVGIVQNIGSLWPSPQFDAGDPVVLYDKYADRWFLSELGSSFSDMFIAVSVTGDPTGSYYTYTFNSPGQLLLDYPKFSVWADGYYMTYNEGGGTSYVLCFERDSMIAGSPNARAVYDTYTPGSTSGFYAPLPIDADGVLPPFGTPCSFVAYSDNGWGNGEIDAVKIWSMSVNWSLAIPIAVITGPVVIPTASFDASYNSNWNDISQPGTPQKLDGIGGVCMFRAQWRSWVGYNTVVLNWGIKLSSTQRSIKWVEMRQNQTTGLWNLYQEGIFAPDASSRWMGSIAMDDNGSIALCYSKSSSAAGDYPSLGFTGRLASDPLGQMTFAETIAMTGTGSQQGSNCGNRYGDYAQTSLDPDGITFWHTGEYIGLSGAQKTRIYSFQLPTITGIQTSNNSSSDYSVYQNANLLVVTADKLTPSRQLVIDLFDISGKKILGKEFVNVQDKVSASFDVSKMAKGTYLVRIGNEKFQKVIKANVQ